MTTAPEGRKLLRIEARNAETPIERKPEWIKTRAKMGPEYTQLRSLVVNEGLHTVCQEAACPNIFECWEDREATFLIGGDRCTRRCDFCNIDTGKPLPVDRDEPRRVAKMRPDSKREDTVMPLAMAGISKTDVMQFWSTQPFDLELPVINGETIAGNCDLCFLKSMPKIMTLVKQNPEKAIWWAKQEETASQMTTGDGNRFRIDRPRYSEIAEYMVNQTDMFDDSIPCFCGD